MARELLKTRLGSKPYGRPISPACLCMDRTFRLKSASRTSIEHRMFSFIPQNWRARPLLSYQTVVDLISNIKTTTGLTIKARPTQRTYPTGVETSASEIAKLNLTPETFHGDWNYSVLLSAALPTGHPLYGCQNPSPPARRRAAARPYSLS